MFTGLIVDVGMIATRAQPGDARFLIHTSLDMSKIDIGDSISCSGVCLTVVKKEISGFWVDVSAETLSKSNTSDWREGSLINIEPSLRLGDKMGGHLVYGHVDAVTTILDISKEGGSLRYSFAIPQGLEKYIAPKGSVALDGISLTINQVTDSAFGVNIIPHTQSHTSWRVASVGQRVNLEIDIVARYVARMVSDNGVTGE